MSDRCQLAVQEFAASQPLLQHAAVHAADVQNVAPASTIDGVSHAVYEPKASNLEKKGKVQARSAFEAGIVRRSQAQPRPINQPLTTTPAETTRSLDPRTPTSIAPVSEATRPAPMTEAKIT